MAANGMGWVLGDDVLIFGLGYTGRAIAGALVLAGAAVTATSRHPERAACPIGVTLRRFEDAEAAMRTTTHVVATAPPDDRGDPVLAAFGAALRAAPRLRWVGYLSTTGVYGDRGGAWVDEATEVAPGSARAGRRVAAELAWRALADRVAVDLFRVAGIYGPGRSVFDELRAGRARRIVRPGHLFGRIHRDDIAGAVRAAILHPPAAGVRVLHLSDDCPAASADVASEAAALLGVAPPPAIPFAEAWPGMSPMARSFWAESRLVRSSITQEALGYRWRYPSYREGLRAILREEGGDGAS